MKLTTTSATLILAIATSINCAPTSVGDSTELSKRDSSIIQGYIYNIEEYVEKREIMSDEMLAKRESQIVTDVLTAIKNTNLAPGILKYFITDKTLSPIVKNTIVALIKNGTIDLGTLLKALNDSGLAVEVIQNLISDCTFYADIYKLAGQYIGDLTSKILKSLGLSKRELELLNSYENPHLVARASGDSSDSDNSLLVSLMESLKDSGLADQVVRQLIVDPDFLSFGADLIKQLFDEDAISVSELVSDLAESGLVPSLIEAFLNLKTFNTVITNALAAAFGKCDGSSLTSSTTNSVSKTSSSTSPTASSTGRCRKKRRSMY